LALDFREEAFDEVLGFGRAFVHLPVGGEDRFAVHGGRGVFFCGSRFLLEIRRR
jgi:hypothetical protein